MAITGYRQLSAQLSAMGKAVGGNTLRTAANRAMQEAKKTAQFVAPVGNPPYEVKGENRTVDPYPVKSYTGRLRTPGFASRNVATKATLSKDRTSVRVMLGVRPEAFYAVQFIELGTSKIPKRPWLEPAFRRSIPAVDARFQAELKKLIDKAALKK